MNELEGTIGALRHAHISAHSEFAYVALSEDDAADAAVGRYPFCHCGKVGRGEFVGRFVHEIAGQGVGLRIHNAFFDASIDGAHFRRIVLDYGQGFDVIPPLGVGFLVLVEPVRAQ